MRDFLDFEKPLKEIEQRIVRLSKSSSDKKSVPRLIRILQSRLVKKELEIFGSLTPWQQVQIARHPQRPSTLNYIEALCEDFIELHGDRTFGDDRAIIGGLATFQGHSILAIGHEKGQGVKDKVKRNFGMANPEGYRKAIRLMQLAEKFDCSIVTFIDTPGAYPGIGAEERGQAGAIAQNLFVMSRLKVPIIAIIIGEGGSGGALALGVADRVLMLENSIYSVISPEGCAAILWEDATKTSDAASALKMNGVELLKLGIIDEVIPEPMGGAHRNPEEVAQRLRKALQTHLKQLEAQKKDKLVKTRYDKYRKMVALEKS